MIEKQPPPTPRPLSPDLATLTRGGCLPGPASYKASRPPGKASHSNIQPQQPQLRNRSLQLQHRREPTSSCSRPWSSRGGGNSSTTPTTSPTPTSSSSWPSCSRCCPPAWRTTGAAGGVQRSGSERKGRKNSTGTTGGAPWPGGRRKGRKTAPVQLPVHYGPEAAREEKNLTARKRGLEKGKYSF